MKRKTLHGLACGDRRCRDARILAIPAASGNMRARSGVGRPPRPQ
ncbi:hypothetical protein NH44784_062181 [Achromobacter xylosoxidans NH44784-1996]|nr:hypothetical protein NH44784_062181 [Achromobacter xylosoxidans NH44784-1996]